MADDTLSKKVIQGDSKALNLVKSLLDNPMLISTNPPFAFSLDVESYSKDGQAEVSQKPVIVPGTGVKQFLNDNVAPQPLSWSLGGYISGSDRFEKTCVFTPVVDFNVDMLWLAFSLGSRIMYKDMNQQLYTNCVIENLSIQYQKEVKNKRPFSMTLREIKEIKATVSTLTEEEKNALPKGEVSDTGASAAVKVDDKTLVKIDKAINPETIGREYKK